MNGLNNPEPLKTFDQIVLYAMNEALLSIGENAGISIFIEARINELSTIHI